MKELVDSFAGTGICNVDFSSNSIKDEGIKIFSEGLYKTKIKEITLYGYLKEDTKQLLMESHPTVRWNFSG
ncbi:MAG: hypothetical protein O3A69_09920 [Proteobacteria bacterium]|nr:hypothetical protein [Pseudomonadota bacterium]